MARRKKSYFSKNSSLLGVFVNNSIVDYKKDKASAAAKKEREEKIKARMKAANIGSQNFSDVVEIIDSYGLSISQVGTRVKEILIARRVQQAISNTSRNNSSDSIIKDTKGVDFEGVKNSVSPKIEKSTVKENISRKERKQQLEDLDSKICNFLFSDGTNELDESKLYSLIASKTIRKSTWVDSIGSFFWFIVTVAIILEATEVLPIWGFGESKIMGAVKLSLVSFPLAALLSHIMFNHSRSKYIISKSFKDIFSFLSIPMDPKFLSIEHSDIEIYSFRFLKRLNEIAVNLDKLPKEVKSEDLSSLLPTQDVISGDCKVANSMAADYNVKYFEVNRLTSALNIINVSGPRADFSNLEKINLYGELAVVLNKIKEQRLASKQ